MGDGPLGAAATARLLDRHGIRPRKALGQHFLIDPNTTRRIVDAAAVAPGDSVVEVGAGVGTLTRALAAAGARVVAYEVDERLRPLLAETLRGLDVEVRFADAARGGLDLEGGPWTMVANLPYNVGTPLLLDALAGSPSITRFVVMLQREAVERLAAAPGGKAYGLPSVVAALHGTVGVAFRVPATVFLPRPEVESAVAVIERVQAHPLAPQAAALAAAGFRQRRKMLRRSLAGSIPDPAGALAAAGIDPTRRAEDLAATDYLHLAEVIHEG
ncbi:MAG: 16S rRNA (adenine(1518)-N(6)/adenine(1519)-N(6))-dimethyltransferase RsmA [Actinobacteria bacterium]|nr:16S rRNA (adenine(1518)-N(6)/adenine(1519)-N(6))-dimethyltransferase RsmA [Actinomycetota bacterium]